MPETESAPDTPTDNATEPVRFAYWVPDVSGGLVTSRIEQRTDWGYEYNHEEVECFGRRVLPLVRELEAQLPRSDAESVAVHA